MAKNDSGVEPLESPSATASNGGDSSGGETGVGQSNTGPPPQSKVTPESNRDESDEAAKESSASTPDQEDEDVAALTEGIGSVSIAPSKPPSGDKEESAPEAIKSVAALLSSKKCRNIVILTGAGVSCSAGIPDFRTPGTGLYDNLQKYELPYPEAVFSVDFYRRNPDPFVQLASELWPGLKHSPTITHSFIALLDKKGILLRNYTQNIDMLDVLAGVSEERMIECHGHFRTAKCIECSLSFDGEECKRIFVKEKRAPTCRACGGYVKPDIVFFGEALPDLFHRTVNKDMKKADLLIVMGTCECHIFPAILEPIALVLSSRELLPHCYFFGIAPLKALMVGPVNMIPEIVRKDCPRVLFNREIVGSFGQKNGPRTRRKSYDTSARDTFHGGDCDESIRILCDVLGWGQELDELNASTRLG
ncbi:hypothetical protein ACHAWF_005171 [Thalassiosira exigua]